MKKKDSPTINVVGTLVDLMLGRLCIPKYFDPGIPTANVHINKTLIPKSLIYLGVSINVMTMDTMLRLNLQPLLRCTTTILQLVDSSTIFL